MRIVRGRTSRSIPETPLTSSSQDFQSGGDVRGIAGDQQSRSFCNGFLDFELFISPRPDNHLALVRQILPHRIKCLPATASKTAQGLCSDSLMLGHSTSPSIILTSKALMVL